MVRLDQDQTRVTGIVLLTAWGQSKVPLAGKFESDLRLAFGLSQAEMRCEHRVEPLRVSMSAVAGQVSGRLLDRVRIGCAGSFAQQVFSRQPRHSGRCVEPKPT